MARTATAPISIFNHVLFGIVTAGTYMALRHKAEAT